MAQINTNVVVPYEEFEKKLERADAADAALSLFYAPFPDENCRLLAIKSILGYVEPDPGPSPEPEPEPTPDPDPDPDPDPEPDDGNDEPDDGNDEPNDGEGE